LTYSVPRANVYIELQQFTVSLLLGKRHKNCSDWPNTKPIMDTRLKFSNRM
jgi:hypothetical protein